VGETVPERGLGDAARPFDALSSEMGRSAEIARAGSEWKPAPFRSNVP
jgi:hypothetical protein